ncbi:hypothetical protein [Nocardia harenae]|uniref:hypothetical protein n=1 Tax=Nocardia harenae TaxID=358707 RepID=UPI000A4B82BC|nr:hypothetical protein [Nocardia harenae]
MTSDTSVITGAEADSETNDDVEPRDGAVESEDRNRSARTAAVVARGRGLAQSSVSTKALAIALLVIALVVTSGVLAWRLHGEANELDALRTQASDRAHAEQVALDYAAGAAEMDFRDLASWRGRLTEGTSPELTNRLTQAATSMEQIIAPLQWSSIAEPITAKVRSDSNGTYSVDCFVNVITKNSQAPDGINSTATYRLTVDSVHDWVITDIAGIDSALAGK